MTRFHTQNGAIYDCTYPPSPVVLTLTEALDLHSEWTRHLLAALSVGDERKARAFSEPRDELGAVFQEALNYRRRVLGQRDPVGFERRRA